MTTLFIIGMLLLILTPLALLFMGILRFYISIARPPTEEELRLAADFNVCPNCGAALEKRWAHCPECGAKLDGTAEPKAQS